MCKKMMSITYMLSFFGTFFNLIKCNRSVATHQPVLDMQLTSYAQLIHRLWSKRSNSLTVRET